MSKRKASSVSQLQKAPTGIAGFDEITGGGLPAGRSSLVCGTAGCGKSLSATDPLVRRAQGFGEPGVLLTSAGAGGPAPLRAGRVVVHRGRPG